MARKMTPRFLAAAGAAIMLVASSSDASVLMEERFSYPGGSLIPNGGWAAHANGGDKPIQVIANRIRLQQGPGSGEDVNRAFPGQGSGAPIFASFFLMVPPNTIGTGIEYFAHFRQSGTS